MSFICFFIFSLLLLIDILSLTVMYIMSAVCFTSVGREEARDWAGAGMRKTNSEHWIFYHAGLKVLH